MTQYANKLSRITVSFFLAALLTIIGGGVTHALSSQGPIRIDDDGTPLIRESNTYGNSFPGVPREWDYVVSNDDYTDIWSSDVLVYSPIQRPTIVIGGSELCVNNSQTIRAGDVPYSPAMPSGRRANDFRIYTFNPTNGSGIPVAYDTGNWNYSAAATCNAVSISLTPAAYSPIDPGTGMYIYRINALANRSTGGKFSNSFHVIAPAGSIVTQSSFPSLSGFGMQTSRPVPNVAAPDTPNPPDPFRVYSDVDIPFGPDCTLTTATDTKHFVINDADNENQYSVQPRPFNVSVLAFTQSTGVYRGPVQITPAGNVNGGARDISGNRTVWEPTGGNQTGSGFDFTVRQGEIYRLRISRVYYNNTLQFRLPYDGAHYYIPCREPTTVRPIAGMSPLSAEVGSDITVSATAQRVGTAATAATGSYIRKVWYDTNRNGILDGTESAPSWFNGGNPTQTGTFSVPAGASSAAFPPRTGPVDRAGRLCTTLQFTNPGPNTNYGTPNPSALICAEIGKRPKMYVADGDVMAGGTFQNVSGVCPTPSPTGLGIRGSTSTISGVTYGSGADYGLFSLGQITTFGSNGQNAGTALSNYLSYGNVPAPLGYFMGTSNPSRCLNNPFAIFGSKPTATNNSASVNVCGLGTDTILNGRDGANKLTLTCSGPLPAGMRRVVYVKNAAETLIQDNIAYAEGPYNSISDMPQLVVLSDQKITVKAGVTRLDGIYAAKTDFATCDLHPSPNQCNQKLEVNGAIVAGQHVLPYRTAGAQGPDYSEKAEIFRLRPDVLLNQLPAAGDETYIRTVEQHEVPPRF